MADRSLLSCSSRRSARHFCRRCPEGVLFDPASLLAVAATFSAAVFFIGRLVGAEYLEAVSQLLSAPNVTEKWVSLLPFGVARSASPAHLRAFEHGSSENIFGQRSINVVA